MPRRLHTGRPRYPLVPFDWSDQMASVTNKMLTGRVEIRTKDTKTYDEETMQDVVTIGDLVARSDARLQELNSQSERPIAGEQVSSRQYLLSVEKTVEVEVDYVARFTECPDDPTLIGRPLRIADVMRGTTLWMRDLIVTDRLG